MYEHYERIRNRREELGWTQKEVADKLFIKHNTYSQYETGKRKIDSKTFFNILEILEIKPTTFENRYEEKRERLIYMNSLTKLFNGFSLTVEEGKNKHANKIVIEINDMKVFYDKYTWIIRDEIDIHTAEILKNTFPNEFIAKTFFGQFSILTNKNYKDKFLKELQTKLNEIHTEISFSISHTELEKAEE